MGRHHRSDKNNDGDKLKIVLTFAQLVAAGVRLVLAYWPGGPFRPQF